MTVINCPMGKNIISDNVKLIFEKPNDKLDKTD